MVWSGRRRFFSHSVLGAQKRPGSSMTFCPFCGGFGQCQHRCVSRGRNSLEHSKSSNAPKSNPGDVKVGDPCTHEADNPSFNTGMPN